MFVSRLCGSSLRGKTKEISLLDRSRGKDRFTTNHCVLGNVHLCSVKHRCLKSKYAVEIYVVLHMRIMPHLISIATEEWKSVELLNLATEGSPLHAFASLQKAKVKRHEFKKRFTPATAITCERN